MIKLLVCLVIFFVNPSSYAERTNINELTDLFEKNIENKEDLFLHLKGQSDGAINQISRKEGFDSIEGIKDAENKSSELNSIKDTDLDNAGRVKRASKEYQFYDENELEPDYTKAGNSMHRLDAKDIIAATENKMQKIGKDFMAKLLSEGFDCKTVKGAIQKEPTYYIEIKREEQNNTEYDQFFCEEPRGIYRCYDTVTMRCVRRGMSWDPWKRTQMEIAGSELVANWKWIFRSEKLKQKHFRLLIRNDRDVKAGIRQLLADKHGVSLEQINTDNMSVENLDYYVNPYRLAWGGVTTGRHKEYMFPTYRIHYDFREGEEICKEWSEDWTERCSLQ